MLNKTENEKEFNDMTNMVLVRSLMHPQKSFLDSGSAVFLGLELTLTRRGQCLYKSFSINLK